MNSLAAPRSMGGIRGFANDRIARERRVSPRTIANQLRSICGKLGITNRNQLASALTASRP